MNKRRQETRSKPKRSPGTTKDPISWIEKRSTLTVMAAITILALGLYIGYNLGIDSKHRGKVKSTVKKDSTELNLDRLKASPVYDSVQEVASLFYCGCGNCGDMVLSTCVCPSPNGGIAERMFIEEQLKAGTPKINVIEMVKLRYGRMIPSQEEGHSPSGVIEMPPIEVFKENHDEHTEH